MPGSEEHDHSSEETLTDHDWRAARAREVTSPHLFVVLECARAGASGTRHSLANIQQVVIGRGTRRSFERRVDGGKQVLVIRLPDARVSSRHASLDRDGASFSVEDLGSHNGTRLNGVALESRASLHDGDLLEVGHTLVAFRASVTAPSIAPADIDCRSNDPAVLLSTLQPALAQSAEMLARVARSRSPVLLLGETGTGKEVLARGIHRLSARKGPLVTVNCGAIPATLVESQLFGHVRGAFSGAVAESPGFVRGAESGTLFLDEIGDLPPPSQAALLRVLQEHEVVPVGGVRPIKVDLRVIAATHRPIEQLVERGEFRSDLYARLAAFVFNLPPLRDRREDIGVLVAAWAETRPVRLTPAAGRSLLQYDWPLNVRELFQTLDVAASLTADDVIDTIHLPPPVARAPSRAPRRPPPGVASDPMYEPLVASLTRHRGNIADVAREFGKARMQVHRWMRRFGLQAESFRRK